ncbi:hypothetical protein PVAND_015025 [Polypedilum vanderplanki]|uniref:NACHT domain-containing protein n=1 Tax=Polypedilum vanderplanki TaxID=319348 RepID=A0A9J6BBG7_POLVA|nr:hypothetical protein PVAND_015025 [Polypedilum vanderplanki]
MMHSSKQLEGTKNAYKSIELIKNSMNHRFKQEDYKLINDDQHLTVQKSKLLKALKVDNFSQFHRNAFGKKYCDIFERLFAIQIGDAEMDEEEIVQKINLLFDDGRPMMLNFTASHNIYKRDGTTFILHQESHGSTASEQNNQMNVSEIEDIIKTNDIFAMRYLELFVLSNETKIIENAILYGNFAMFLASIDAPFKSKNSSFPLHIVNYFKTIYENDKSLLKIALENNKTEVSKFIITNFKRVLKFLPYDHKKSIVNLTIDKEILLSLIEIDFPFPKIFNDENLKKSREIFAHGTLEEVEEFVNENIFTKIAHGVNGKSALLNALENHKIEIFSYLKVEAGFIYEPHEKELIKNAYKDLSDEEKKILQNENAVNADGDGLDHIRLLTNKFKSFTYYEDKNQYKISIGFISKYLEELNNIPEIRDILNFCAKIENLKYSLDFENEFMFDLDPLSIGCCGSSYGDGLIFIAAGGNERRIKETIIHESLHIVINKYYENKFEPYFEYDDENRKRFKEIVEEVRSFLKKNGGNDDCDGIISSVFNEYERKEFSSELIVRILSAIAFYNNDKDKVHQIRKNYNSLFEYSNEFITNAINIEEINNREKVRYLNKHFNLLQNIKKASNKLELSSDNKNTKNSRRAEKIRKINKSVENQLIVTNTPKLALLNLRNSLESMQFSLYDAKNIFIDLESLDNDALYDELNEAVKEIKDLTLVVDFSKNLSSKVLTENKKFIFVTTDKELEKCKEFLNFNAVTYQERSLNYVWFNLKPSSQKKLLATEISFQDKNMKLNELINDKLVTDDLFISLANDEEISINCNKIFKNSFYIERKFLKTTKILPKTSIILPDKQNIQINPIYEYDEFSLQDLIIRCSKEPYILISDLGGSGKSRALQEISNFLLKNLSDWILFVDLQKYLTEFQNWTEQIDIFEFFKVHFGKNLKHYEKKIFEAFYELGKVKILFDGFDEISPNCKEFVLKLLKTIKNNNQIWVTTRKHLEVDLEKELKSTCVFSLKLFDKSQQIDFLVKYWKFEGIIENSNRKFEDDAKDLLEKIFKVTAIRGNLIGLIQQLKVFANICIEKGRINIESVKNCTMYELYKKSVYNFIKNRNKTEIGKNEIAKTSFGTYANFDICHQYYAIKAHFGNNDEIDRIFEIYEIMNLEQLARGGIISYRNEEFSFIHATYAEYFLASFILNSIERKNANWQHYEIVIKIFIGVISNPQTLIIRMFINEEIGKLNISEEKIEIFMEYFKKIRSENIFQMVIVQAHENTFNFLWRIIEKINDDMKYYYLVRMQDYPLYISLLHMKNERHEKMFQKILQVTISLLNSDEFFVLLNRKFSNNYNIWHTLQNVNIPLYILQKFVEAIIQKLENNKNKIRKLLAIDQNDVYCPLISLHYRPTVEKLRYFYNIYEKYFTPEEIIDNIFLNKNKLSYIYSNAEKYDVIEFFYQKIKNLKFVDLLYTKVNENDLITVFFLNCSFEVYKAIWDCIENDLSTGKCCEEDIVQILSQFDNTNNNFFHFLLNFDSSLETHSLIISKLKKYVPNKLKKILLSKNYQKVNFLQTIMFKSKSLEFLENHFNFFLHSVGMKKFVQYLTEINRLGHNVFALAIGNNLSKTQVKFIIDYAVKNNLSKEELKSLIKPKETKILDIALNFNGHKEVHEYLWEVLERYFNPQILKMINEVDLHNRNLFFRAIASDRITIEILSFTWQKIKEHLKTFDKQRAYLKQRGFNGKNVYEFACLLDNEKATQYRFWVKDLLISYGLNDLVNTPNSQTHNLIIPLDKILNGIENLNIYDY